MREFDTFLGVEKYTYTKTQKSRPNDHYYISSIHLKLMTNVSFFPYITRNSISPSTNTHKNCMQHLHT